MYEMSQLTWSDVTLDLKCRVGSSGEFLSIPYELEAKDEGGVYVFIAHPAGTTQQVIYVGQTDDLHRRMGEYARGTFPSAHKQEKRVAETFLSYIHANDVVEFYVASAGRYLGDYRADSQDAYEAYDSQSETNRLALEGMVALEFMSEGYDVINDAVLSDQY
jgi:hypothetical protein